MYMAEVLAMLESVVPDHGHQILLDHANIGLVVATSTRDSDL